MWCDNVKIHIEALFQNQTGKKEIAINWMIYIEV